MCTASTPQSSPLLPLPSSTVKLNRPVNHTTGRHGTNYLIYPCSACSSACPSFLFFRLFLNEFLCRLNTWLLRRSDTQEGGALWCQQLMSPRRLLGFWDFALFWWKRTENYSSEDVATHRYVYISSSASLLWPRLNVTPPIPLPSREDICYLN